MEKELQELFEEKLKTDIEYPEIAELEDPIRKILWQILPKIEAGEYGLIIGDDASARIQTRIFEKVINAIYDQHGYPHPNVRFIAGSSWIGEPELKGKKDKILKYFEKMDIKSQKKVLIVTDVIATGQSMLALGESLYNLGVSFDVAAINAQRFLGILGVNKLKGLGAGVYSGDGSEKLYNRKDISGVYKLPQDLFSNLSKQPIEGQVAQTRQDAFAVADHLIDWYNKKEKKKVQD